MKWMGEHAPVFGVNGEDVSVLHEPNQFFTSLKVRSFSKFKVFAFEYGFFTMFYCFLFRKMSAKPSRGSSWLHCTWALGRKSNNL